MQPLSHLQFASGLELRPSGEIQPEAALGPVKAAGGHLVPFKSI